MTVSLADLLNDRDLGLRLLTGFDRVRVSWAHSSDLSDPTPFLESDNLLLTTGTQFAEDAPETDYDAYVARLVDIGVAAVGFGTEVVRSGTPGSLVAACVARNLPLLEVPFRTPFLAIVRRIADARAAQAHARDVWTLEAQRSLSLAALSRDRIGAVLDELAHRLGAAVLLLDAHSEVTSTHGRRRLSISDTDAIRIEAARLLQRRLRSGAALDVPGLVVSLQTLGRRDELRGVLAVAVDVRPDPAATAVITSAVALAEFAVEDAARQQEATLTLNGELLELALSGALDAARRVLAVAGRALPRAPLRVLQARLGASAEPGELEHALTVRAGADGHAALAARRLGTFVAVVEDPEARAAAEVVAQRGRTVVMSRSVDWSGVAAVLREGLAELDRGATAAGIVELGAVPLLGLFSRPEVAQEAERRLAPLLDAPDTRELRRGLEAWFAHDAAWEPAARELGIHRHTLKAQVHRAGSLLGLELDRFDAKAELWALLQAV